MTDALTLLRTRRSVPAVALREPGPSPAELELMLTVATRVPDHGKLAPWRFILFEGEARFGASEALGRLYVEKNAQADPAKLDAERRVLARAPLVVAVASRAAPHPKIPEYEQLLSAGAVCMNLLTAAHAMGYAANWLTGWHAYDEDALRLLGVGPEERIAGFIHIGTASETPTDRPRPDVRSLVTRWQPVQG